MSVVFSAAVDTKIQHRVECLCGAVNTDVVHPDYNSAYTFMQSSNITCDDAYCYVDIVPFVAEPEVQLSNNNAIALLDVLGVGVGERFMERCTGSMSASDLLGRVLIAEAVAPISAEVPSFMEGNIMWGGRAEGYIQGKLAGLKEVALFAHESNRVVVWG